MKYWSWADVVVVRTRRKLELCRAKSRRDGGVRGLGSNCRALVPGIQHAIAGLIGRPLARITGDEGKMLCAELSRVGREGQELMRGYPWSCEGGVGGSAEVSVSPMSSGPRLATQRRQLAAKAA